MQSNLSMVAKRYLLGGALFLLLIFGLIIGAVHPFKHASGSQPVALPDVQALQVQQEDVPIYGKIGLNRVQGKNGRDHPTTWTD